MDFEVGQTVVMTYYKSGDTKETLEKVEKITDAGNIRVKGLLFRKDGVQKGSQTWGPIINIKPATNEDIERINKNAFMKKAVRHIENELSNLSYEQLVKIIEIIDSK